MPKVSKSKAWLKSRVFEILRNDRAIARVPTVFKRGDNFSTVYPEEVPIMTKPHRRLKKANHGARPANSKARKAKRRKVKTRV